MKIVHLSTSSAGGAGLAALRLANYQLNLGHDVEFITAKKLQSNENFVPRLIENITGKAVTLLNRIITEASSDLVTPFSADLFSWQESMREQNSVIHLHNSYNLIKLTSFLKFGRFVPIVITLHDERVLTGGCHTTLGCVKFRDTCSNCPQSRFIQSPISQSHRATRVEIENFPYKIEAISPSRWLKNQVESSPWARERFNVNVISNMIPRAEKRFTPQKSSKVFRVIIVAASASVNKGLNISVEAMSLTANRMTWLEFELVMIGELGGHSSKIPANLTIVQLGKLSDSEVLLEMAKANLILVPSRSENAPNVIGEAQLVNLMVLASNVGGIPEMVSDHETGFLCEPNSESIAAKIEAITQLPDSEVLRITDLAKRAARLRHDSKFIHERTLDVYARAHRKLSR